MGINNFCGLKLEGNSEGIRFFEGSGKCVVADNQNMLTFQEQNENGQNFISFSNNEITSWNIDNYELQYTQSDEEILNIIKDETEAQNG